MAVERRSPSSCGRSRDARAGNRNRGRSRFFTRVCLRHRAAPDAAAGDEVSRLSGGRRRGFRRRARGIARGRSFRAGAGRSDAACCARIAVAEKRATTTMRRPRAILAPPRAAAVKRRWPTALETMRGPGALIVVYERDTPPAKIRRAVEQGGLAINCSRPYDNQLAQFAEAFARNQDCASARAWPNC